MVFELNFFEISSFILTTRMPKRNWRGRQMQGQWENRVGSILGTTLKIDMENHKKKQHEMLVIILEALMRMMRMMIM